MRFLLAAALFISLSAKAQSFDVLHYNFEIKLEDATDKIQGKATIQLKYLAAINSVTFDLKNAKDGKGMTVKEVTGTTFKQYNFVNDKLEINLSATSKISDTASFTIVYEGVPADGLIIAKNKYGHRGFFADNWPNRGHNWIPCFDLPSDKAAVDFIITAPDHFITVANGIKIEETELPGNLKLSHWKETVPIATKVMVIGVADFAMNLSGMVDCIPVYSYVYPEDRSKGFYDYAQANEILPFFINYVGPYGYNKLANVQSKTRFGGLENANTIFYSENSVTGTRESEALLTHEIAHQWFGNMATEKSFAHLWLSEGFATYMTILYFEKKYGVDTALSMLESDRRQVIAFAKKINRSVVDSTTDYMALLNENSYQKGGWILHMLRKQLGDSVFHRSIMKYYATYSGKNADTEDLQKIFEKESGKNLSVFFKQWLYEGGIPRIEFKWTQASATDVTLSFKQIQKTSFQFPIKVLITTTAGKKISQTIDISTKDVSKKVAVPGKIKDVQLDPDTTLLFEEVRN